MAHTLSFSMTHVGIRIVKVSDGKEPESTWFIVHRDNNTIIAENEDGTQRRVYAVREWCRSDQCRATRME